METPPSAIVVQHGSGSSAWVGPIVVAVVFLAVGFWLLDTGRAQHVVDAFNSSKKKSSKSSDSADADSSDNVLPKAPAQAVADGSALNVAGQTVPTPPELRPV